MRGARMEATVRGRAVQKAAELLGGEEELGARLGLNVRTIRLFISGRLPVPTRIFLQVIDIVAGDDFPVEPESPVDSRGERLRR